MPTPFPRQPAPDPDVVTRARARLLAQLSRLDADPTEAEGDPDSPRARAPWLGPQGDWEAAHGDDDGAERYRLGPVFARGGLGAVRRAEDRKLGRTIAIKELLRFDDKALHRFAREAAITARLQHPGVVSLYDLGRDAEGRPFLCMKLVEGESLEQKIAARPALAERLELLPHMIAAAEAVAYAHARGVLHRDLKPANILVGELGEAVVIDWGLAKDMSQETGDEIGADEGEAALGSDLTAAGTLLGTLRYMPPEQARGDAVDPRSDLYALGAALYHLIAGVAPFHEVRAAALVQAVLRERPRPLASLVPGAPPALVAVVDKAMAADPERRYADASALAGDLRRFQADLLVGAHTYSPAEVARLWLRRHRAVSAVAAGSLAAIGALAALSFGRIRDARDAEHGQRVVAEARAAEAEAARAIAARRADDLILAQARLTLEVDPSAAFGVLAQLSDDPAREGPARALATAAWSQGLTGEAMTGRSPRFDQAIGLADGTWLLSGYNELWRWRPGAREGERLRHGGSLFATPAGDAWAIVDRSSTATFEVHPVGVDEPRRFEVPLAVPDTYAWTLLPGGQALIGASSEGGPTVAIDVATGRLAPMPGPDAPAAVAGLRLLPSSDGRRLVGVRDGRTLVAWDRAGDTVASAALPEGAFAAGGGALSPDGRTFAGPLVGPGPGGGARVFVWREGAAPRLVEADDVAPADGAVIFVRRDEGRVVAWAEAPGGSWRWTRALRPALADERPRALRVSRDGRRALWSSGGWDEVVDVATGDLLHAQVADGAREPALVDGDALLVRRGDGLLRVDLSQRPWRTLAPGQPDDHEPAALAPGGAWALRYAHGAPIRVDVAAGVATPLEDLCWPWTPAHRAAIADDGRALVVDDRGLGCLYGQGRTDILDTPAGILGAAAFAPDGAGLAAVFDDVAVEWRGPALERRSTPLPSRAHDLRYAADGSHLVALGWDGEVTALVPGAPPRTLARSHLFALDMAYALAFAPTGATLVLYRRGALGVELHDLHTGATRSLAGAQADNEGAPVLRFSPSGDALAAIDGDLLQRWSLVDVDAPPLALEVAPGWDLAFLDERRIAIAGRDGGLEVVEVDSGARAPMRRGAFTRRRPLLAAAAGGLVLRTGQGELLRYTDPVPGPGAPLRAWLRAIDGSE
ncbi:MAG: serine/threonine-protein kinase [Nannocystaceae bacterium]